MNLSPSKRRLSVLFLLASFVGIGIYTGSNAKNIVISDSNEKALLWCGVKRGIYGIDFNDETFEAPDFLEAFNGSYILKQKGRLINEATLDLADNPFGAFGINFLDTYINAFAEGIDVAIEKECSGETGAYLAFTNRISSAFDETATDNSENEYASESLENYEDYEAISVDPFSCATVSEPEVLEDILVFKITNNCDTDISLISWDVNISDSEENKNLLDTSSIVVSSIATGQTKQEEVYIDIPEGDWWWEIIPSETYL